MLLKLYNDKDNNKNKEKEKIIEKYKDYEELLQINLNSLENYLSKLLILKSDNPFQWSTNTYSSYGFYYQLQEDNTKAIKISDGGTITVCRTINSLEKGSKYKLEYYINYTKGDFDVGFGDEKAGPSCWLRNPYSYCISSCGIYILGNCVDSNINLINSKKITFIVDLINYNSEIYIDEEKKYAFNISQDLIYYPMIAIRELNNSVKLKSYKSI